MTNQDCRELTLILHNHWYQQPSVSFYNKGDEEKKNGLSLSFLLLQLVIFKLARKCDILYDFGTVNMRYKIMLTITEPAFIVILSSFLS